MEDAANKHMEQLGKLDKELEFTLNTNAEKKNKILESKISGKLMNMEARFDNLIHDTYLL